MASTLTDANSDNPYVRLEGACTSQRRVYSLLSPLLLMLLLLLLRSPVRQQPALVSLGSNFGLPDSVVVVTEANVAAARERLRAALLANGGPNCHGQFSPHRYAFLFAPGSYDLDVEVGFYTQVAGLGRRPEDVTFTGRRGVHVDNCGPRPPAPHVGSPYADVGALDNFWRSAENLRVSGTLVWATSQAAPLRSVVAERVELSAAGGWASGGFAADLRLSGAIAFGTQQQSLLRTSELGGGVEGLPSFNSVFLGVTPTPPPDSCGGGGPAVASVGSAPLAAEKPFLFLQNQTLHLALPPIRRQAKGAAPRPHHLPAAPLASGDDDDDGRSVVFVATPSDSAAAINRQLARGRHVVLTPGLYALPVPLRVATRGQVLLGLGFATLTPMRGLPAVELLAAGVRMAGVLVQAGPLRSRALVVVGDGSPSSSGTADAPILLHDCFVRVYAERTAPQPAVATTMLWVRADHVVVDHAWLWRADHDSTAHFTDGENPVQHALEVDGRFVTVYGLFAEHTLGDLTRWRGEDGAVFLYQSELQYDAPPPVWPHLGYNVTARHHRALGVGVYCYFFDEVTVHEGIHAADASGIVHSFTHLLDGGGAIQSVINGRGGAVSATGQGSYVCSS